MNPTNVGTAGAELGDDSSEPLLEEIRQTSPGFVDYSFSTSGTLVYVPGGESEGSFSLVWVDREGAVEPLGAKYGAYRNPRLSPDGQRLAVTLVANPYDVWVYDIPRHTLTRLTFEGDNRLPVWAPDGKQVAFRSNRAGGTWNLYWKPADGSGAAERLTTSEHTQTPSSWSLDGKFLAFYERATTVGSSTTEGDIWVLPLEGERKPQPFLQTQFYESSPTFSPDGSWLAYVSNESGRNEVYVLPYPGPGGKWQISTEGGREPVWARNGRELFYRNERGDQMMVVDITTEPTFRAGAPRLLFEGNFELSSGTLPFYDISPDGQRFVMIKLEQQERAQINVVQNWFEELKRLVPTGE